MTKYTEFGQKRLPVITIHLTVTMKLKLYVMLKKGIWKGTQIMFYKVVILPTLTCSGHTTCRGSELFGACRLSFL
jgi:hypothetical protein